MLKFLYENFKDFFFEIARDDIEVGFNICYDYSFYVKKTYEGMEDEVRLPDDEFIIGSFHTHVNSDLDSWEFSKEDIISGIIKGERYMFLKVDNDIYGVDLSKYKKTIENFTEKKIKVKKLIEIINNGMILF